MRPFEEPPSAHLFGTSAALYQVRAIYSYSILCAVESSLYGHFGLLERPGKGKKKREKERAVVTLQSVSQSAWRRRHIQQAVCIYSVLSICYTCTIHVLHTCVHDLHALVQTCMHVYICTFKYVHTCIHTCMCVYACVSACTMCACMRVFMYVYVNVCIHVSMYVRMHVVHAFVYSMYIARGERERVCVCERERVCAR